MWQLHRHYSSRPPCRCYPHVVRTVQAPALLLQGVSACALGCARLCACLLELELSSCEELDDVGFVSSLVRLRTLDLSDCSEQLVDVSPLSSLTSLNALYLGCDVYGHYSQLVDVSPLSLWRWKACTWLDVNKNLTSRLCRISSL